MQRVLIIGANSPLGRSLSAEFQRQGWYVIALVRKTSSARSFAADQLVEARFTDPDALCGVMTGVALVVSCFGVQHKSDTIDGLHIDYLSILNLLQEAKRAAVEQFICVGQLHGLSTSQVMRAVGLGTIAQPQTQQDPFENTRAPISAARIHTFKPERNSS